jgi:multidrug efflux pump subunit AcrA (membrane-fusion protein)
MLSGSSGFIAACVVIFNLSNANASVPPNAGKPEDKKPVVFVAKAAVTELSEILTYPARIEPRIKASVLSEADGVVTKIVAPLGSSVKARATLLYVRNTDPVYRFAAMAVTAPVAGVVSRVEVTEGSRVAKGDKLALVTDPSQVRVVVEVTADDVRLIKNGQLAELTIPGSEKAPTSLKVKGISPFVDPATGTALCELEAANSKTLLPLPGSIARVSFRANVRNGISIADDAVTYRGKDPYVRIVSAGKAKLVAVVLGRKQAGAVEILKGLKAGDTIVERTSKFVGDGEAVEVQDKSQGT